MKKTTNHIDNLYKKIDGAGELPPAYIWEAVENALDDHEATLQSRRAKNNRNALLLLLFLIVGSAGIFWLLTGEEEAMFVQTPELTQKNKGIVYRKQGNGVAVVKQSSKEMKNDQPAGFAVLREPAVANLPKAQNMAEEPLVNHTFETADIVEHKSFMAEPIAFTDRNQPAIIAAPQQLATQNTFKPAINNTTERPVNNFKTVKRASVQKFSVTAFFAPDITTRNLEQDAGSTKDEGKDEMAKTEKNGALDFTFGARVDYKLNKHFSIQSGISFSTNTIDIAEKTVYARYDKAGNLRYRFNMSSGYCFFKLKNIPAPQFAGDSARTEGSHSTLHYINIPLIVKYNFPVSRRIDLAVQAGIVARFIAWENIATTYDYFGFKERSISRQIEGLKKNYFNGVVGIGAEYALNKKVALTVFPSFNFATSSINKDAPVKAYPNTLSLAGGVKFNF